MKKSFTVLLTIALTASIAIGCSKQEETGSSQPSGSLASNNLNQTGLPIVKEKVNLTATVVSSTNNWNTKKYFQDLEKATNVHVEFQSFGNNELEKFNLMFASRDFPDIILGGGGANNKQLDKQIQDAAAAGDIIPLNDLIDKYAPNWKAALAKNPYLKKVITAKDGNIYTLPIYRNDTTNSGIRDQWLINTKWLNELGLKMPTTTEEFYQVLKAFKENAGKGSIPKNVIPWYYLWNNFSGGNFDLFGSFGVLVYNGDYIAVKDGKVQFQAMNPAIKEPLKYLNRLYKEGLIPPESFTDDGNTFAAKYSSNPPVVGSFSTFHNPDMTEQIYDAMLPIKGPGVDKPLYRRQVNTVDRNLFEITKKNKNPEASMRWIDTIADPDWSIQGNYGMFGDFLEKQADGTIKSVPNKNAADLNTNIPNNTIALLLPQELMDKMTLSGQNAIRAKNVKKYEPYVAPLENFYPPVLFTSEQNDKKASISTDVLGYVNKTFSKWVVEGGIDQEWDAYVKKLKDMKVDEMIKVYQDALDDFNKQ
ncbi:extracellular solute-binding protein [Paenibacillus whitsoniae]|uniref:Extracellular solute-binding protein n=1 Tax=Paenibacillus whitsoniae TaxID=2496558 RepID=A0A430JIL5_9BACL|nr:extracellular solute-binding protein [Paenibacillus whitsoniae]RTE10852.1 extracellular solute-binding protein [Paenibacillus whitsoniae]